MKYTWILFIYFELKCTFKFYVSLLWQKVFSKSSVDQLQDQLQDKDTEILLLRRQLTDRWVEHVF